MKITIQAQVNASLDVVWEAWNNPEDIKQWNAASDDWHTTQSEVDLREGGRFSSRMEAKDGSFGFDFEGVYTKVEPKRVIEYRMPDGREVINLFTEEGEGVSVQVTFDAETENDHELQRQGWQAILDHFAAHAAAK